MNNGTIIARNNLSRTRLLKAVTNSFLSALATSLGVVNLVFVFEVGPVLPPTRLAIVAGGTAFIVAFVAPLVLSWPREYWVFNNEHITSSRLRQPLKMSHVVRAFKGFHPSIYPRDRKWHSQNWNVIADETLILEFANGSILPLFIWHLDNGRELMEALQHRVEMVLQDGLLEDRRLRRLKIYNKVMRLS